MENWEEQNFNSAWRDALTGAEAQPSSEVWKNIDARLMQAENTSMKKRVVFYQRMAAVSIGILFLVSGYAFFINDELENTLATNRQDNSALETSAPKNGNTVSSDGTEPEKINADEEKSNSNFNSARITTSGTQASNNYAVNVFSSNQIFVETAQIIDDKSVQLDRFNKVYLADNQPHFQFSPEKIQVLPKRVKPSDLGIAYRVADAKPAIHKKKKNGLPIENTWAALGVAAGSFSQNASNLDLMQASLDATGGSAYSPQKYSNAGKTEKSLPGSSFSMALLGGKRLAKRWLLQGGLNYLNQNTQSKTSAIEVASANSLKADGLTTSFSPENANSVTYTTNSQINSTFQFISLPVQAGYMLVDQKLGVQLNGGISPDIFLRSVMSDKASGDQTVNTTGSSSTFKTMSISGLGGVELSYRIAERYRVSLVPGFRYSITSVYKENSLASSKPFTADIGLRFRYVFN